MSNELATIAAQLREFGRTIRTMGRRPLYQRVRFWAMIGAAMTFHIGLVLALGGERRVSAHAYEPILRYGGPDVWGSIFMAVAVFTGLGIWRWHKMLRWALIVQAIPHAMLAVSFAITASRYSDVILIASPTFAWIAIIHVFLSDYAREEF